MASAAELMEIISLSWLARERQPVLAGALGQPVEIDLPDDIEEDVVDVRHYLLPQPLHTQPEARYRG